MGDYKARLVKETNDLRDKVNKLHDFIKTKTFYKLDRKMKDLRYKQFNYMLGYLQTLGQILEELGIELDIGNDNGDD